MSTEDKQNKYASTKALIDLLDFTDSEKKSKALVDLLADPDFAEGAVPVERNCDVFVPYPTVYAAAHNGPAGEPADNLYDAFPDIEWVDLPKAAGRAPREERAPRERRAAREEAAPEQDETQSRVSAALRGVPEAEDTPPEAEEAPTPTRQPDPAPEEKPARTRRRTSKKTEEKAAKDAADKAADKEATEEPEADEELPAAVDAAVARAEFTAKRVSYDEAKAILNERREALERELAGILYAIDHL